MSDPPRRLNSPKKPTSTPLLRWVHSALHSTAHSPLSTHSARRTSTSTLRLGIGFHFHPNVRFLPIPPSTSVVDGRTARHAARVESGGAAAGPGLRAGGSDQQLRRRGKILGCGATLPRGRREPPPACSRPTPFCLTLHARNAHPYTLGVACPSYLWCGARPSGGSQVSGEMGHGGRSSTSGLKVAVFGEYAPHHSTPPIASTHGTHVDS